MWRVKFLVVVEGLEVHIYRRIFLGEDSHRSLFAPLGIWTNDMERGLHTSTSLGAISSPT